MEGRRRRTCMTFLFSQMHSTLLWIPIQVIQTYTESRV